MPASPNPRTGSASGARGPNRNQRNPGIPNRAILLSHSISGFLSTQVPFIVLAYLTSALFFRVENAVVFDPQLVTPAGSSWLSIPDSNSIFQTSGPSSHPSQLTHPSQTLITTSPQFINDYSHPIHLPTASLTESPPILTLPIDPLTPPTMFDLPDAKRYAAPPIPSQQPLTNPSQRPTRRPLLLPLLLPRLQPRNRNPQTPNRIRSRPQRPSRPPRRHHPPPSPYF